MMQTIKQSIQTVQSNVEQLETSLEGKQVVPFTCQGGWSRFRDHCYYFSKDQTTWFLAEKYCRTHGSFLGYIVDEEENSWIKSKTAALMGYWLGGSDLKKGQWLWNVDFTPFNFTKWDNGEPNGNGANCLHMYGDDGQNKNILGKWNDHSCDTPIQYVCKKRVKCDCDKVKSDM